MADTIRKSTRTHKKYMSTHLGKTIHWGDNRYEQFRDSTPLKLYSHLDHGDLKRKRAYFARFGPTTDRSSPMWWSHRYLWT